MRQTVACSCLVSLACFLAACEAAEPPASNDDPDTSVDAVDAAPAANPVVDGPGEAGSSVEARIEHAMSAAPAEISEGATIMEIDDAGELVELRAGTNGWLCLPDDNPAAPGDAAICADGPWQEFFAAYMAGETPAVERLGVAYMLRGGPAASNSDPFAQGPAEGEDWVREGPHLMVIVPDAAQLEGFPTEPTPGQPYVMWSGTPFAHLMVPVVDG